MKNKILIALAALSIGFGNSAKALFDENNPSSLETLLCNLSPISSVQSVTGTYVKRSVGVAQKVCQDGSCRRDFSFDRDASSGFTEEDNSFIFFIKPRRFEKRRAGINSKNLEFIGLDELSRVLCDDSIPNSGPMNLESATYSAQISSVENVFKTTNSVIDARYKKRGSKLILTGKLKDQSSDSPAVADGRYRIVLD
ncbi:MAG: hypothetical protein HRT47_04195 [Candidatus Caenarcaniphilales bacterium]|nr:hypothetical protein [Candidatus Caenarcaniphilales bacterium]